MPALPHTLCVYIQRHRGFVVPLSQAFTVIAISFHFSLHNQVAALVCQVVLLLVSQLAWTVDSTSALLDAGARISEPCRFHARAWTSYGAPMKSLSSKAAAVPLPAVCWSSRDPATRLPELPWAPAPATKKPSTLLLCHFLQVHSLPFCLGEFQLQALEQDFSLVLCNRCMLKPEYTSEVQNPNSANQSSFLAFGTSVGSCWRYAVC